MRMRGRASSRPAPLPPSYPQERVLAGPIIVPFPAAAVRARPLPSEGPLPLAPPFRGLARPAPALPSPGVLFECRLAAPAAPLAAREFGLPEAALLTQEPAAAGGAGQPLARVPQPLPSKPFLVPPTMAPRAASGFGSGALQPLDWEALDPAAPSHSMPGPSAAAPADLALPRGRVEKRQPQLTALPPHGADPTSTRLSTSAPGQARPTPLPLQAGRSAGHHAPEVPSVRLVPISEPAGTVSIYRERASAAPPALSPHALERAGGTAPAAFPGPAAGPRPWAGRQPGLVPLGVAHIVPPSGQGLQAARGGWSGKAPKPALRRLRLSPAAYDFKPRTSTVPARRRSRPQFGPWFQQTWRRVPAKAKWAVMSLPLALLLVQQIDLEKAPAEVAAATAEEKSSFSQFLEARWENLRTNIMNRAAISLTDDFRSGLGYWTGDANWGRTWSYDEAGFILPGALALYEPSLNLVDYEFALAARIERLGVSWVFRAKDTRNYYAGRLVVTEPGPLPKARLINYTVIDGRRRSEKSTEVPFPLRDKMYQIRVVVRGSTFTTYLDDRVVGLYKDATLKTGGVGLFRTRGEKARVRWISVMHQYDLVGRLCALIAPYNLERPPGGWSE